MLIDRLESNRRGAYRVQPVTASELQLSLECDGECHAPDQIGDVSLKGVSIRFLAGRGPELRAGTRMQVAVALPSFATPTQVSVRVVAVAEGKNSRVARLEFEDIETFTHGADADVFRILNRRTVVRGVAPALGEDLQARVMSDSVEARHLELPVGVRNISAMGIALIADEPADRFLSANAEFVVSMHVPGAPGRALVSTRTCYRTSEAERVYFGCAFQWEPTPNAIPIIESLTNYMLDRIESAESGRT